MVEIYQIKAWIRKISPIIYRRRIKKKKGLHSSRHVENEDDPFVLRMNRLRSALLSTAKSAGNMISGKITLR